MLENSVKKPEGTNFLTSLYVINDKWRKRSKDSGSDISGCQVGAPEIHTECTNTLGDDAYRLPQIKI
jgi:hypothetical protein